MNCVKKIRVFSRFPREVMAGKGIRKVVHSKEELVDFIKTYGRNTSLFMSVYSYAMTYQNGTREKADYTTARVNKIFWDIDGEHKEENLQKLHEYYVKNDILHTVIFSGQGYHLYALVKEGLQSPKQAIKTYMIELMNKLKLKLDTKKHIAFFGDLSRVARIPSTYHVRAKRWCTPLTEDEILKPFDELAEKFRERHVRRIEWVGSKVLDLTNYDQPSNGFFANSVPSVEVDEVGSVEIDEDKLPRFIKEIISKKRKKWDRQMGYVERRVLICFCREVLGLTEVGCAKKMREWLTESEYKHMLSEVPSMRFGQVSYIYKRGDVFLPNCETLLLWGICKEVWCDECWRRKERQNGI